MFSEEQKQFIYSNLRRPDNDKGIALIASRMAQELCLTTGVSDVTPEIAYQTALLMNLGETDERISYIYNSDYNWKEHPEAINLNKLHGAYSVEMAESIGIELTEEQKAVIAGHSEGKYPNVLGQIIKISEICRATESPRLYRGERKDPAKSWKEVHDILIEDPNLSPKLINIAKMTYGKEMFPEHSEKEEAQI